MKRRIRALVNVAARNGSSIASDELQALLPSGWFDSPDSLEQFVQREADLRDQLVVAHGEVAPRAAPLLTASRNQQRDLSEARVAMAKSFAAQLARISPFVAIIGISGSTAYGGAKARDDIDFFLATKRDRMWISLLFAMVIARVLRSRSPRVPVYCFNRVTEYAECLEAFRSSSDPLFAREALSLRLLNGEEAYRGLLSSSTWMERFFPALYRERLGPGETRPPQPGPRAPFWYVANLLAFATFAPYLWLAGLVRNRALARRGRTGARFQTVVRRRFFAFESNKYEDLRKAYREAFE